MEAEIKGQIRQFLAPYFHDYDLQDGEDIFEVGIVDSLFAMQLVVFLELNFDLSIDNESLTADNFHTVDALANLVMRLKKTETR